MVVTMECLLMPIEQSEVPAWRLLPAARQPPRIPPELAARLLGDSAQTGKVIRFALMLRPIIEPGEERPTRFVPAIRIEPAPESRPVHLLVTFASGARRSFAVPPAAGKTGSAATAEALSEASLKGPRRVHLLMSDRPLIGRRGRSTHTSVRIRVNHTGNRPLFITISNRSVDRMRLLGKLIRYLAAREADPCRMRMLMELAQRFGAIRDEPAPRALSAVVGPQRYSVPDLRLLSAILAAPES